jgi:RimJ/RimL family protein N-acetyltransferase
MFLEARRVRLRPFMVEDLDWFYPLMLDPIVNRRFRWGGATPHPEEVANAAWDGLCHFAVERRRTGEAIGVATLFAADFRHGFASAAVLVAPHARGWAEGLEGFALLVDYAFQTWPLRKIYSEVLEESYAQFSSGAGRFFAVEGRKRAHQFVDGRYQDVYILAIHRDMWLRPDPLLVARGVRPPP